MVGITSRSMLHPANSAYFFDGYYSNSPAPMFTGNLKSIITRSAEGYLGPGSSGTGCFILQTSRTISVAPRVNS